VSAGLDYAAVGPEHAYYRDLGRIEYAYATDDEVLERSSSAPGSRASSRRSRAPTQSCTRSSARERCRRQVIIVNLSGRGDKDVQEVAKLIGGKP